MNDKVMLWGAMAHGLSDNIKRLERPMTYSRPPSSTKRLSGNKKHIDKATRRAKGKAQRKARKKQRGK